MSTEHENPPLQSLTELGRQRFGELRERIEHLLKYISVRDLCSILFPPTFLLDILQGNQPHPNREEDGFDERHYDPELMEALLALAKWLSVHYFSTTIHDIDRFTGNTPTLIVGNHSAGFMPIDALFAVHAIRARFGTKRRVYSLGHDFMHNAPRLSKTAHRVGILRARKKCAIDALHAGHHVLVYPGGDKDAFRTFSNRKKIVLSGRKGFVRIALMTETPIIPMVSAGLHESFLVLGEGRKIADKIGFPARFRTDLFPMAFSLPWGFTSAFLPFLPMPTSIEMKFCDPLHVVGSPDDEILVNDIYMEVLRVMQSTMDELYKDRIPFFGRQPERETDAKCNRRM